MRTTIRVIAIGIGSFLGVTSAVNVSGCKDWERGMAIWESRWIPFVGCEIRDPLEGWNNGEWTHQDEGFPCRESPNVNDDSRKACQQHRRQMRVERL
jgi:hypothetical protein